MSVNYNMRIMEVDEVYDNRKNYVRTRKTREYMKRYNENHPNMSRFKRRLWSVDKCIENFFESFRLFVRMVLNGDDFDIEETAYYRYLLAHIHPNKLGSEWGRQRALEKAEDSVELIKSIRDEGVREPFDMWLSNGRTVLHKGYRRLVILKELRIGKFQVRIWKSKRDFRKGIEQWT